MGRKSNSKQNAKKSASVPKENNKFIIQRRKELAVLIDKLLKLTSVFQATLTLSKCWEHYLEVYAILKAIKEVESTIHNGNESGSRQQNIESFIIWLKDNGALFEGIEISEFVGYDLGLKATKDFTEGSLLLTVPRKLMMTETDACDSELGTFINVDPLLQNMPNITLALFLLLEKSNPDSFWRPYINILPEKYTTILYYTSEELSELKPSPVLEQSLKLYRSIARQYAYFYNKIFSSDVPVLKKLRDIFSYESYRWAVSTVMTRQNNVHLSGAELDLDTTAFIPLWDMCNHEHGKITTDFNSEKNQGECFALRDFKEGEQIFIYYGARPNSDLFLHNGFVYGAHALDLLSLSLGVGAGDAWRDSRLRLLSRLGLGAATRYCLYSGRAPVSPELRAFLRVFNMNPDELSAWSSRALPGDLVGEVGEVDAGLERRAHRYLHTRCTLLRDAYRAPAPITPLAPRAPTQGEELSAHRKNIQLLKECECKILDQTLDYLNEVIAGLPEEGNTQ